MGLPKHSSYLIGTWHSQDGNIHHVLRGLEALTSGAIVSVFSNSASDRLEHRPDAEATMFRGGVATSVDDGAFICVGGDELQPGFVYRNDIETVVWRERGLVDVSGTLIADPTQWYNPWRDGSGAYCVTMKYRVTGTVLGETVDGFLAHELHFFPEGFDFLNSPFGVGGREVHWGHMATAFDDGTTVEASLAIGADGWGFALLTDETGAHFATTELEVLASVRANGYPERIVYRFLDQEWEWRIGDRAERADIYPSASIPLGAEGVLRRVGDERTVVTAMGSIDWWRDGREAMIPSLDAR